MNKSGLKTLDRVLFAGGGSGGHLYPALAVADVLSEWSSVEIRFAGTSRPVEEQIFASSPYQRHVIESVSSTDLKRAPFSASWRFLKGLNQAHRLLREFRPQVVVGCGGFGSLPTVISAHLQRIPIVLMEQNVVPGLATSLLARVATKICVPYEGIKELAKWKQKLVVTGNPVRREISALSEREIDEVVANRLVLVIGGSQGSTTLNDAVVQAFARTGLPTDWRITHLLGASEQPRVKQAYEQAGIDAEVLPFARHIASLYEQAGLVVCRAGAMTLAELACIGVPAIIIPLPDSARDHQRANAHWFAERDSAIVLDESESNLVERLAVKTCDLLSDNEQRRQLSIRIRELANPRAAANMADHLQLFAS